MDRGPDAYPDERPTWSFALYVAGTEGRSARVIDTLGALLRDRLPDGAHLRVIDVVTNPAEAERDRVIVTPTLVRLWPPPRMRAVGDLARVDDVVDALGLPEPGSQGGGHG